MGVAVAKGDVNLLGNSSVAKPSSPMLTGVSGTASTTRYWDCSKPTCAWASKCLGSGHGNFASDWNQLFKGSDGRIYGTVASSGSFGMDDAGGACMKCYDLTVKDGPAMGKQLTVMATNYCPDEPTCPAAGETNPKGQQYHFDIAIPGGGLGGQGKCSEEYGGGDWKVLSADDCGKLPEGIQSGCNLWYNDLDGMDNPLVDWVEVSCPSELADRCGTAPTPAPTPPAPTPPAPTPAPAPTPPTPTPTPTPPAPGPSGGRCCWGGSSCDDDATNCHEDPYCGASEEQCTGNCAGMWCPMVDVLV